MIYSPNQETHMTLKDGTQDIEDASTIWETAKVQFFASKSGTLGHIISTQGIAIDKKNRGNNKLVKTNNCIKNKRISRFNRVLP